MGEEAPSVEQAATGEGSLPVFSWLWAAQVLSLFGNQLTGFAVGVELYSAHGSKALFAAAAALTLGPQVILSPLAGVWVDRLGARRCLAFSHAGALLCSVALLGLCLRGALNPFWALLLISIASAFNAPQSPAFAAATHRLVPPERYGRVAALNKLGAAAARLGAPFVAAACLKQVSLAWVVAADCATFIPALLLLSLNVAESLSVRASHARRGRIRDELLEGVAAVRARPELQLVLSGLLLSHFMVGALQALVCPLVLSIHDAHALSILLAVAALGMVAGALLMVAWKRAADPVRATLWLTCIQGLWVAVFATQHALGLVMFGAFGAMAFVPLIVGNAQAAWQTSLPAGLQGRGEGLRGMVTRASLPLSSLIVAPLADFDLSGALAAVGWPLAASEQGEVQGATLLLVVVGFGVSALCASLLLRTTPEALPIDVTG